MKTLIQGEAETLSGRSKTFTATGEADLATTTESWQRETKSLGQVPTPKPVAVLMAKWVMSATPSAVLDPAGGLGGLYAACRSISPRVKLVGVECDAKTFQIAKTSAPSGTKMILADYLRASVGLFEGIIANPPYVKAQRLNYSEADWGSFEGSFGTPLSRHTNLYALFLLKIWEDLAPRGRAAVILPAEFMNANFGEKIKERLLQAIRPVGIVIFSSSLSVFSDALTTSAIVLLDKSRSNNAPVWATLAETLEDAETFVDGLLAGRVLTAGSSLIDLSTRKPQEKWLNLLLNGAAEKMPVRFENRVGDYFDCRRGIATGANDFFCLSQSEMREHDLTNADVEPCITKTADAEGLIFTDEKFKELSERDRKCFLLNPSQIGIGLNLARYLELGKRQGIPQRYLPSHRPAWYVQENRGVAKIWVAVFSRESVKFILNNSVAKNLTCFHCLYAQPGNETLSTLMALFLNSSLGRESFSQVNRFYGGGLRKIEPKDVESMPCPVMPKITETEAKKLTGKLMELERLPLAERTERIDEITLHYFASEQFYQPRGF